MVGQKLHEHACDKPALTSVCSIQAQANHAVPFHRLCCVRAPSIVQPESLTGPNISSSLGLGTLQKGPTYLLCHPYLLHRFLQYFLAADTSHHSYLRLLALPCRYLAVRSQFPVPGTAAASGQGPSGSNERSPLEKNPLQPASLRRHHLYATPVSRRSLMLAGRGKQALQEGQAWQSKVSIPCTVSDIMSSHTPHHYQLC